MGKAEISDDRATDLFGNPVRDRQGRRGRPPLEVSDQDRDMVEAACARGWTNERIANAVGISPASLKRHFRSALTARDSARDRLELAVMSRTVRDAIAGNVSAQKEVRKILERDELKDMARRRSEQSTTPAAGKGKKAEAREAAESAGGDGWGDDLMSHLDPRQVN